MKVEIKDIWFVTDLPLEAVCKRLNWSNIVQDAEDYWEWCIGKFEGIELDITRTHTKPANDVNTRIFRVDSKEIDPALKEKLVSRLKVFLSVIHCGEWKYTNGNDYEQSTLETTS